MEVGENLWVMLRLGKDESRHTSALWGVARKAAFPWASQALSGIWSTQLPLMLFPGLAAGSNTVNNSVNAYGKVNPVPCSSWLGNTMKHHRGVAVPGCWLGRSLKRKKFQRNLLEIHISQEFCHSHCLTHLHFHPLCQPT